jgi:hypothetical protein
LDTGEYQRVESHPFSTENDIAILNRLINCFDWIEQDLGRNPLDAIIEILGGYDKVAEVCKLLVENRFVHLQ